MIITALRAMLHLPAELWDTSLLYVERKDYAEPRLGAGFSLTCRVVYWHTTPDSQSNSFRPGAAPWEN